ncbi:MAG TPA: hypothetical protein DCS87_02750 [Rheinheimera sp.]|nr:hypothetical protein [Rheinheimera sp.]
MKKHQGNPLVQEYRRSSRRGWFLVLTLSLALGAISFVHQHQQRIDARQQLLNVVTLDLQHQLQPYFHLLKTLQLDAGLYFNREEPIDKIEQNQLLVLNADEKNNLLPAEINMLVGMKGQLQAFSHSVAGVKQLGYRSQRGYWFDAAPIESNRREQMQQLTAPLDQLNTKLTDVSSWAVNSARDGIAIAVPVRHNSLLGYWVVQIDLIALLKELNQIENHASIILMNDKAVPLLTVQDAQLVDNNYDGLHQNDIFQGISGTPFLLHVQPDGAESVRGALWSFLTQWLLFLVVLTLLHLYQRYRFKKKVLGPFARLVTHWNRLERGDAVGVRHVPTEWKPWFEQADRIAEQAKDREQ